MAAFQQPQAKACREDNSCSGSLDRMLRKTLQAHLPPDAWLKCRNKGYLSISAGTPLGPSQPLLVTDFTSQDDLISAAAVSSFIPLWSGSRFTMNFRVGAAVQHELQAAYAFCKQQLAHERQCTLMLGSPQGTVVLVCLKVRPVRAWHRGLALHALRIAKAESARTWMQRNTSQPLNLSAASGACQAAIYLHACLICSLQPP
jgi:hypothetical protein